MVELKLKMADPNPNWAAPDPKVVTTKLAVVEPIPQIDARRTILVEPNPKIVGNHTSSNPTPKWPNPACVSLRPSRNEPNPTQY